MFKAFKQFFCMHDYHVVKDSDGKLTGMHICIECQKIIDYKERRKQQQEKIAKAIKAYEESNAKSSS